MDTGGIECAICEEKRSANDDKVLELHIQTVAELIKKAKCFKDLKWVKWQSAFSADRPVYAHKECQTWYRSADLSSYKDRKKWDKLYREFLETESAATSPSAIAAKKRRLEEPPGAEDSDGESTTQSPSVAKKNRLEVPSAEEDAESAVNDSTSQSQPTGPFDFAKRCLFCGFLWCNTKRRKGKIMQQDDLRLRLLEVCEQRHDAALVKSRILQVESLVQAHARYHANCMNTFLKVPKPSTIFRNDALIRVYEYIRDSKSYKFKMSDLLGVMGTHKVTPKTLGNHLSEEFGDDIQIISRQGAQTYIYYEPNDPKRHFGKWYMEPKSLSVSQKIEMAEIMADVLEDEILSAKYNTDNYRPATSFFSEAENEIPVVLRAFLNRLIKAKYAQKAGESKDMNFNKRCHMAHSIITAIKSSKTFSSHLQLSVGIYVYQKSGCRLLVDYLSELGVCCSYYMLRQWETSVIKDPPKFSVAEGARVQHVFGNTNHNAHTLTGHNTFHCMGGIAIYTPAESVTYEGAPKKITSATKIYAKEFTEAAEKLPIIHFVRKMNGLENIEFVDVETLPSRDQPLISPLYMAYFLCMEHFENIPSYKGFMEIMNEETNFLKSKVVCLPVINLPNLPSSNLTAINSALHRALADARAINQRTAFVTFDQPLYWKARDIVASSGDIFKDVVIRLGGFHTLMSFLGAIGHVMAGSGLENIWASIYAPESVGALMSGHAYARALRAHVLTYTALAIHISHHLGDSGGVQAANIESLFGDWDTAPPTKEAVLNDLKIDEITGDFNNILQYFKTTRGPTAKLWALYFECVTIALQFFDAEHAGNWDLHLLSLKRMLPIFTAAQRHNYAKSAQLYLQDMYALEEIMDDAEFHDFTRGSGFTVKRSDKFWSGTWTDMIMEQNVNKWFGMNLTHGRGTTPSVNARFSQTMPSAYYIMNHIEELYNTSTTNSEQHVNPRGSRLTVDHGAIKGILAWFEAKKPFEVRHVSEVVSLSTGLAGNIHTDCHQAMEMGQEGMKTFVGKCATEVSCKKAFKVSNLAAANAGIHFDKSSIKLADPTLLFQRLSVIFDGNVHMKIQAFGHELTSVPLSLFDGNGFMRKASKSDLYDCFGRNSEPMSDIPRNATHVVDGGFLLHSVSWPHSSTYGKICEIYRTWVVDRYGKDGRKVVIVFDGYNRDNYGIKSYERFRRQAKKFAPDIIPNESSLVTTTREQFLSSDSNKRNLIDLLRDDFLQHGLTVYQAPEDAATLITTTAKQLALGGDAVVVVSNDTDLLVLLTDMLDDEKIFFLKEDLQRSNKILYAVQKLKEFKNFILFSHAFSGCDSTSSMHSKGKKQLFKILKNDSTLQKKIQEFYNSNSSLDSLYAVGIEVVGRLYEFDGYDLGKVRYEKFTSACFFNTTSARLAHLPPTKAVLIEHVKRVYYQIQLWKGNKLDPTCWGWRRAGNILIPVMNPEPPAPEQLLRTINCKCTTKCAANHCTCKKLGVPCTKFCTNCVRPMSQCENRMPPMSGHVNTEEITEDDTFNEIPSEEDSPMPCDADADEENAAEEDDEQVEVINTIYSDIMEWDDLDFTEY